jgi:hypothetical protein
MVTMYDDEAQNYNNFPPVLPSLHHNSLYTTHYTLVLYDDVDTFFLNISASSKKALIESSENIKWKLIFRFAELSHYSPNQTIYSSLS